LFRRKERPDGTLQRVTIVPKSGVSVQLHLFQSGFIEGVEALQTHFTHVPWTNESKWAL